MNQTLNGKKTNLRNTLLTLAALCVLVVILANAQKWFGSYVVRICLLYTSPSPRD